LSRLETLKKLESSIENFLASAVDELEQGKTSPDEQLNILKKIAGDSLKGRFVNNRLDKWLSGNRIVLESNRFTKDERTIIGNLLSDIKSGLDESDNSTSRLFDEIGQWREMGAEPKRKMVLKMKRRPEESNLLNELSGMLEKESGFIGSGLYENAHILSALDDVLKSAELKENKYYIHLAASMIYFLKMKGYKITPFVKRLRVLEKTHLNIESGDIDE
jgi:hypothetical protein